MVWILIGAPLQGADIDLIPRLTQGVALGWDESPLWGSGSWRAPSGLMIPAGGAYIARFAMCAMTDRQGALTPGLPERGPLSPAGERGKEFDSEGPPVTATKHDVGSCRADRSEQP